MADKNMVMVSAELLRDEHGFSQAEIDAADESGLVGEREVEGVGTVKYYISMRGTARMPDQMGDHTQ